MQPGITVDEAEESEATGRIRLIFRSLFFTTPYRRLSPRPWSVGFSSALIPSNRALHKRLRRSAALLKMSTR